MVKLFGTPDGIRVGQFFESRRELSERFVHRPPQGGISGNRSEGADSIVLSGGYVDDQDDGDVIIYTGHGGNDRSSNRQIADQSEDDIGNAGLITSHMRGLPVRVSRGAQHRSPFSPPVGYRYAGLYIVTSHWRERGRDGFIVVRFRLERIAEQAPYEANVPAIPDPSFATTIVTRRIRDSALARAVKRLYNFECQVCGTAIVGDSGVSYAEGAHVRPLGRPHLGGDAMDNLLCLCPNHHTTLDLGGMFILDDMSLAAMPGASPFAELRFLGQHSLHLSNARYHRDLWSRSING